jgi:ATP-dependent Clp protease protease subunit
MAKRKTRKPATELTLVGEVNDWEADTLKALLDIPPGGECTLYIDSAGGSVYGALAVASLLRLRRLRTRAVVLSECSSAAVLIFAACQQRFVVPYSTLLFHRIRWESEKRVAAEEAGQWARHFEYIEREMDQLLVRLFGSQPGLIERWIREGRYVTGKEVVEAGLAEMLDVFA